MAESLAARRGKQLMAIARASIEHGLRHGEPMPVRRGDYADDLFEAGAAFVTLHKGDDLRGCIGTPLACRPLAVDVAHNAYAAAFADPRFPPLAAWEWPLVELSISLLSAPEPMQFEDEADLLRQLRPGVDGLIIEAGEHRALFLPAVWDELPDPRDFLGHLKAKAGLPRAPRRDLQAWRFVAEEISAV